MRRFSRPLPSALAAALLMLGAGAMIPSAAQATPSYCGISWGSLGKSDPTMSTATVSNVRSGRHQCFDRMVVDVAGDAPGYDVAYVPQVRADGSGLPVPLRGGAYLQVVVRAPAYGSVGQAAYSPANRQEVASVGGYQTFRQVAWAGTFEGQTTLGLGVRARLPYRVLTLDGPGASSRVVVDVAHYW
jgi:hypothetical protein